MFSFNRDDCSLSIALLLSDWKHLPDKSKIRVIISEADKKTTQASRSQSMLLKEGVVLRHGTLSSSFLPTLETPLKLQDEFVRHCFRLLFNSIRKNSFQFYRNICVFLFYHNKL